METFSGRTVAISGGCGALGLAIAHQVGRLGADLLLIGRRPEIEVRDAVDYLHGLLTVSRVRYEQADVCRPDEVRGALGPVDNLGGAVVAAGVRFPQRALKVTAAVLSETVAINLVGGVLFAQACANRMIQTGITDGSLVVMSSAAADTVGDDNATYGASMAGLESFTRVLAVEIGNYGLRLNICQLGMINAGMGARHMETDPAVAARASITQPLGRLGTAGDVAGVVAFLLGPDSAWMTGATVRLDGGARLTPTGMVLAPAAVLSVRETDA